jgi:hypothetical protein
MVRSSAAAAACIAAFTGSGSRNENVASRGWAAVFFGLADILAHLIHPVYCIGCKTMPYSGCVVNFNHDSKGDVK